MAHINRIRNEQRNFTTNADKIQNIIREYFKNLYFIALETINEMGKFLDYSKIPKLNQEDTNMLNELITKKI